MFRAMTNKKGWTIAYGLWHSTRIEGITINILTEVFGIESLAKKIKDRYKDIEIIKLKEDHLEA